MGDPDLIRMGVQDNAMVVSQCSQAISCRLFRALEMASKLIDSWWTLAMEE
jgi:hypothetical protein